MQFVKAILHYDDQTVELPIGKMTFFEELYVDFKKSTKNAKYQTYHLIIHPKQAIQIKRLALLFEQTYVESEGTQIFCNGYQSWSESRAYGLKEKIPQLKFWAKNRQYFGDEHIKEIPRGNGKFHSWTYTYLRNSNSNGSKNDNDNSNSNKNENGNGNKNDNSNSNSNENDNGNDKRNGNNNNTISFMGSLKEDAAFTYFIHDTKGQRLIVEKDCRHLELTHSYPALDIFVAKGTEEEVYNNWFTEMEIAQPTIKKATGWTSWYNYYTNISEEIILKNLAAFEEKNIPIDIFQIDDGYQTHVGDWLNIKSSFPNGMSTIARAIKQANYKPGIWLAPFVCSGKSDLFRQKKHWLVKNQNGNPQSLGKIKYWGGDFYALDFYQREVQEYLIQVIHVFTQKWGFEFVKLDFLYAVCVFPKKNKTRGQIMADAMEFLGRQLGNKMTLGCGVPLGSVWGKVDYCRISCDVHLRWENQLEKWHGHRERVSTLLALRSTLGRFQLNNRAFRNDPDVFILRNNNNQLSPTQQYTLLIINALCGDLLFTSDFIGDYTAEQLAEFNFIFLLQKAKVKKVQNLTPDKYSIYFDLQEKSFVAICNLNHQQATFSIKQKMITLAPFESIILKD
ncbi:MAG: glycoside hydrolase family 36 protein [Bacteroidota bacterium]